VGEILPVALAHPAREPRVVDEQVDLLFRWKERSSKLAEPTVEKIPSTTIVFGWSIVGWYSKSSRRPRGGVRTTRGRRPSSRARRRAGRRER